MSSVIKAGTPARSIQGVAFNLEDIAQQAGRYLEEVRTQAAEIIATAHKEADAIRAQAEQQGRQAAMKAAEQVLDEKVGKRMETLLPALRAAVEGVQQAKHNWLRHWEKSAVHLATAIASRVMRKELLHEPKVALALVAEALELAAGSSQLMVRVNPADHQTVAGQIPRLSHELGRLGAVEIVADPQISLGGCRVETRHGVIDQQFETQLARIEAELTET